MRTIENESLAALTDRAVDALASVLPSLVAWTDTVRPEDGTPGRFRWARESTREANVAATAYILGGLERAGILDRVWTPEDRQAAVEWVRALHIGNEQYRDPSLVDRPSPNWPQDQPWPSAAMLCGNNQYARKVLRHSGVDLSELPPDNPPPGWPQAGDTPATMLEWVKSRPYDTNAWSACSHGMRMARYMLRWHKEGRIPLEPLIDALTFFYSIQDPDTGLWGNATQSTHVRINGTFKLFPLMREILDLPIPYADGIVDQVLAEFARPDYDDTACGCDEWDNWYVLALVRDQVERDRDDLLRKVAAWRIARVLEVFRKEDGGLSFHPGHCNTHWIGFDMAPKLPQGDAMGLGILPAGLSVCIDLLGIKDATPWTNAWRMHQREDEALRTDIETRVRDRVPHLPPATHQ